jgi:F0F1-type ATP synthase epsilon subunit
MLSMQNFTTTKDAQIVDVKGLVQTEFAQNTALKSGDELVSGTVLTLAQDSEILLVYEDGAEQRISSAADESLATNDQTTPQAPESAIAQAQNSTATPTTPDIDAIEALIESGDDIELPDTAAGGLTGNEGTDFINLARDGKELLAGAGFDTIELDNAIGLADVTNIDAVNPANINIAPVAQDDSFSLSQGTAVTGNVITHIDNNDGEVDSDAEGDTLSVTQVLVNGITTNVAPVGLTEVAIAGGILIISANGEFTYTNSEGFDFDPADPATQPSFGYTLSDGTSTDTASVSMTISDSAPVANDDTQSIVLQGNVVSGAPSVTVSGNIIAGGNAGDVADTSADGTVTLVSVAGQFFIDNVTPIVITTDFGQLSIDSTGAYVYTSKEGVALPDDVVTESFAYVIEDGDTALVESDTATLTIDLTPELVNIAPVAQDDSFSLSQGTAVTGNVITHIDNNDGEVDSDAEGDTLSVTQVLVNGITTNVAPVGLTDVAIAGGTLIIGANGDFTYINSEGFDLADPATQPSFGYTLSDGTSTDTASVSMTITDSAPAANDDTQSIVLRGDIVDGAASETVIGNIIAGGNAGDVTDTSADGTVTLVSVAGQFFIDNVTPIVITTDFGQLSIVSTGAYVYTSKEGVALPDDVVTESFAYVIEDGDARQIESDTATLTINLTPEPVNLPPEAEDDSFSLSEGTQVSGNVITHNDGDGEVDADAEGDTLSVTQVVANGITTSVAPEGQGPTVVAIDGGTLSISANGEFTYNNSGGVDYDPLNEATSSFGYTLSDGTSEDNTPNVLITINDSAPVANDDSQSIELKGDILTGAASVTVSGNIIAGSTAGDVADTSADGTVTLVSVAGQFFIDNVTPIVITTNLGQLSILSSGEYSYTSQNGVAIPIDAVTESFAYVIEDGDANQIESDTAVLTINLTPERVNLPPEAEDDSFSLSEGTQVSGNVITHNDGDGEVDTDADGDTLLVTKVDVNGITTSVAPVGPTVVAIEGGSLIISANGDFTYTNSEGFDLADPATQPSFRYTLSDGSVSDSADAKVSITITDSAPVANDDTQSIVLQGNVVSGAPSVTVSGNIIAGSTAGDVADTSADGTVTLVSVAGQFFADNVTPIVITTDFGQLSIDSTGAYVYTSKEGVAIPIDAVTESFAYVIEDGDTTLVESDTATLRINLTPELVNIAPVAQDDSFSLSEGTQVSGNVITHIDDNDGLKDTDADGDDRDLKITHVEDFAISGDAIFKIIDGVLSEASAAEILLDSTFIGTSDNGILRINADGEFTYENKGFLEGTPATTFEYTLSDADTATATAEVTIKVNTNAPVANDDENGFKFDPVKAGGVKGNVTGLWFGSSKDVADDFGSDNRGLPAVTQVVYQGVVHLLDASNTPENPINISTVYGDLSIDNLGTYEFAQNTELTLDDITKDGIPKNIDGNLVIEFTYTIQDGDLFNSDISSANLVIEIKAPLAQGVSSTNVEAYFDETSGLIDTDFDTEASINVEDPAFKHSSDLDDLSDILTDEHASGLENYLAVMSKDDGAISEDAVVLEKGETELEPESFTTVTNGLLADGAILISDATASNAPIGELDSAELL